MITLLWAQTENGVVGKNGQLPWKIKEEMQHFVDYTMGKSVLMGRKTWDSIPKKPLKGRKNYVVSRSNLNLETFENTYLVNNVEDFIKNWNIDDELVIIGGVSLYNSTIRYANKLVVSIIKKDFDGDVLMCQVPYEEFIEISRTSYDEFEVITFERK